MNLNACRGMWSALKEEHELDGWEFSFDNGKTRFGLCDSSIKFITMSKHLVSLNSEEECKKTMLHEIAHALVGPGHGHDDVWARKCREIGIQPLRCYDMPGRSVVKPKPNFYYRCPKCTQRVPRFRRSRRPIACARCCLMYAGGKFSEEYMLERES